MTQNERVLELLREHGADGVTPVDALHIVGTFRLAARIKDLRDAGHNIETQSMALAGGKHIARYVLRPSQPKPTTGIQTALALR